MKQASCNNSKKMLHQEALGMTASRKTSAQLVCSQRTPWTKRSGEGQSVPATPPDVGMKSVEVQEEEALETVVENW